jgi:hypothetical protein
MDALHDQGLVGVWCDPNIQSTVFAGEIDGDSLNSRDVLDTCDQAGSHRLALMLRRHKRNLSKSSVVVSDM